MSPLLALGLKALVVGAFAGISVFLGSPLVSWLFARVDASAAKAQGAESEDLAIRRPTITAAAEQLRGGYWIGILERMAVFASVIVGFGEGIAIVLAVKSLARYPELRATSSAAAERFIIGTFASVLIASACAGLASWLISLW